MQNPQIQINPEYNISVHCIWCNTEYILFAKEIWFNAYQCRKCGKLMGIPIVELDKEKNHYANQYQFNILISSQSKLRLLKKELEKIRGKILCEEVLFDSYIQIGISIDKPLIIKGIELKIPKLFQGQ